MCHTLSLSFSLKRLDKTSPSLDVMCGCLDFSHMTDREKKNVLLPIEKNLHKTEIDAKNYEKL